MTSWVRALFILAALAVPLGGVQAAGAVDEMSVGPKVGAAVPTDIKVQDQNGQERDFKSLARRRGLIVLFSRSLSW